MREADDEEEMEEEKIIIQENTIINKEYYEGIKNMIKCVICLNIITDPEQCNKCQHIFCSACIKKAKLCPLKCQNNKYIPSPECTKLLSGLKIKCDCNKEFNYDFYLEHKKEECENADLKKRYEILNQKYKLLTRQLNQFMRKDEVNDIKHKMFVKTSAHKHPVEVLRRFRNNWFCDICRKTFKEETPSYHCTLCDFDICYNCIKNKVTKGTIIEGIKQFYS